jgi:hypothetical protein
MKKNILLVFLLMFSVSVFSQNLPEYYIVKGDTAGLILSIDQVKKIKNDLELKALLEDMMISCDSTINKYIIVVDDYEKRVVSLNATITKLDSSDANKERIIGSLRKSLGLKERDLDLCDLQSSKKDTIISNNQKIITGLKIEKNLGFIGTATFLLTSILLLLIH